MVDVEMYEKAGYINQATVIEAILYKRSIERDQGLTRRLLKKTLPAILYTLISKPIRVLSPLFLPLFYPPSRYSISE